MADEESWLALAEEQEKVIKKQDEKTAAVKPTTESATGLEKKVCRNLILFRP